MSAQEQREKIIHLYQLGVPAQKIIETHLGYGKYLSLKSYLRKRKIHDLKINPFDGLKNEK